VSSPRVLLCAGAGAACRGLRRRVAPLVGRGTRRLLLPALRTACAGRPDGVRLVQVDKVPLDTGLATQIFVNVSIGTPRQPLKVILDTGSSVFAVFCGPSLPSRLSRPVVACSYPAPCDGNPSRPVLASLLFSS
jgi:hypothetical protein